MIDLVRDHDGYALVRFDTPGEKVNLISEAWLGRLSEILDALEAEAATGSLHGVLFASGKKGVFLAGADVNQFVEVAATSDAVAAAARARRGQAVFSRIAALPVPTLAAINGACLGGGLEMALACTARLAADAPEVSIGLPEVRLGLIPGWGGTQRLPRLIGASRALDLILTGRTLTGRKAARLGVVDGVVPAEGLEHSALGELGRLIARGPGRRPSWSLADRVALARPLVFWMARRGVLAQTKGRYPAPLAALDVVRRGLAGPIDRGLDLEAARVGELLVGDVSRNLVAIFLSSRATAPPGEKEPRAPRRRPIERIGVLGAGAMGAGIAAVAAMRSVPVRLKDVSAEALGRGMKQVHAYAAKASRKGILPRHEAPLREALVAPSLDSTGLARCDLVIEAVVENLDVKRAVLAEMEQLLDPEALFATNTSSLSVAAIAEGASRPGRVLGLHFFNPVEKMPLVEVVRAPSTDPEAVSAAVALARRLGKTPVVVGDTPGFIVNRILMPYLSEAMQLLSEGAATERIDRALEDFGMPMGPLALLDQIGIDVAAKVADVLHEAFAGRPSPPGDGRLLHALREAGLLGAKSGRGFYVHRGRGRRRVNPAAAALVKARGSAAPEPADVVARLVDAMINEAALLLEEKAVQGPEVIDLAMIFGAGFPPYRGGLLRHADSVGAQRVAARLRSRGIEPSKLLEAGGRFHS